MDTEGFFLMYQAHIVVADFVDKMQWRLSVRTSVKSLCGAEWKKIKLKKWGLLQEL